MEFKKFESCEPDDELVVKELQCFEGETIQAVYLDEKGIPTMQFVCGSLIRWPYGGVRFQIVKELIQ